jgi:hypothetical protein
MNIRLLTQAVLQILGLKYATVKYRKIQKAIDSYVIKVEYTYHLPVLRRKKGFA